ncbi:hypothetical protein BGY98DRAFT_309870 [Russula aff. rugulosa BPL654]|nr:hypothetical protein BGY98DRAFT_309870 [Russula aff. rugulosa BPL654]
MREGPVIAELVAVHTSVYLELRWDPFTPVLKYRKLQERQIFVTTSSGCSGCRALRPVTLNHHRSNALGNTTMRLPFITAAFLLLGTLVLARPAPQFCDGNVCFTPMARRYAMYNLDFVRFPGRIRVGNGSSGLINEASARLSTHLAYPRLSACISASMFSLVKPK